MMNLELFFLPVNVQQMSFAATAPKVNRYCLKRALFALVARSGELVHSDKQLNKKCLSLTCFVSVQKKLGKFYQLLNETPKVLLHFLTLTAHSSSI